MGTVAEQFIQLGDFDLTGKVYGGIRTAGGYWKIKQDGAGNLFTGARKDTPEGASRAFRVVFDNERDAEQFLYYFADKEEDADLPFYYRFHDWHYRVWGVVIKDVPISEDSPVDYPYYIYDVACYLYSPFGYSREFTVWKLTNATLNQTLTLNNPEGHYPSCFESLAVTCHYSGGHVQNLALAIDGVTLPICDYALSNEIWELLGNDYSLLETYEDLITSGSKWGQDAVGSGTYSGGAILLNNSQSAYFRLSGPNLSRYPVRMTADLSLDGGGATNKAYVEVSEDAVTWEVVLNQDDFENGVVEYVLEDTEYMGDIYVRFRCDSGTSGKYLRIGSVKFEVERWIEDGIIPTVPAKSSKVATLSCNASYSKLVDILGTFHQRRKFI